MATHLLDHIRKLPKSRANLKQLMRERGESRADLESEMVAQLVAPGASATPALGLPQPSTAVTMRVPPVARTANSLLAIEEKLLVL